MAQAALPFEPAPQDGLRAWPPGLDALAPGWHDEVAAFLRSPEGVRLDAFLRERLRAGAVIYPPDPLRALRLTPLADVHAVVLGQDPYHGPGQAEGLAFSVARGVRIPPSLRNILAEAGVATADGSLVHWARQGVLLLNAILTVEQGAPASHARQGWEALTDRLLARVAATASPCVYLLWGAHAQAKAGLIRQQAAAHQREILLLECNHPSPLAARRPPAPFIGSGHFAQARAWLAVRGITDPFR